MAAGGAVSRIPNSPVLAANFSVNQGFALAGRLAYVGLNERLIGERNAGFDGNTSPPNYREPGYALTDIQGDMTISRFQLALFVRNVLNRRAQVNADTELLPVGVPAEVNEARRRTVGFTLPSQFRSW